MKENREGIKLNDWNRGNLFLCTEDSKHTVKTNTAQVYIQNFSLEGADSEAIHNLCLILKIML